MDAGGPVNGRSTAVHQTSQVGTNGRPAAQLGSIEDLSTATNATDKPPLLASQKAEDIRSLNRVFGGFLVADVGNADFLLETLRPSEHLTAFHGKRIGDEQPTGAAVAILASIEQLKSMAALSAALGQLTINAPALHVIELLEVVTSGTPPTHIDRMSAEGLHLDGVVRIEQAGTNADGFPSSNDLSAHGLGIHVRGDEPQLVGVRVPAVVAVGYFQRPDEAPEASPGLETFPGSAST